MVIMVVLRSQRDAVKPLLMKLGVAITLTVAGFLCSQFKAWKPRSLPPPTSPGVHLHMISLLLLLLLLLLFLVLDFDWRLVVVMEDLKLIERGKKVDAAGGARLEELPHQVVDEKSQEEMPKIADPARIESFPNSKTCVGDENLLLPEFNELVQREFEAAGIPSTLLEVEACTQKVKPISDPTELEIVDLRNMVQSLRERERNLEIELLEYYGLKEQESVVRELENRLKINTVETKFFSLKIESLVADNRQLQAQLAGHSKILDELESARAVIAHLKWKLISEGEQHKELMSILQQEISALRMEEHQTPKVDEDVQNNLRSLKSLEDELKKLKSVNLKLQREKLNLVAKLDSTQILTPSVVDNSELKALEKEAKHLREANKDLEKEIEQLRMDRCTDAEELVYLKWVNACLRYELRNYNPSPGKTVAKDLNKSSSPTSEEKAKELILEYANSGIDESSIRFLNFGSGYYAPSYESTVTDAGDCDESPREASSSNHNHDSKRPKFLSKLKKLVSGKDGHNNPHKHKVTPSQELAATYSFDSVSSCLTEDCRTKSLNFSKFSINKLKMEDEKSGENQRKSTTDIVITPRSFADIERQRKLSLDETRWNEVEFPYGYKRFVLEEDDAVEHVMKNNVISKQVDDSEKSELTKYARALQRSRRGLNNHRRSISFDFS